jgi:hypothetical protein
MTRIRVWRCFSVVIAGAFILGVGAITIPAAPIAAEEGTWQIQTVDATDVISTSLALDSNDNPRISYSTGALTSLHYAQWTGIDWAKGTVDPNLALTTSLKLDSRGQPRIAYSNWGSLRYTYPAGGAWTMETVDATPIIFDCSLALDSGDRPHVSYSILGSEFVLNYTHRTDTGWQPPLTVENAPVGSSSIAIDRNDRPRIAYAASTLTYAEWTGSNWAKQSVDPVNPGAIVSTSLALDSNDLPNIAYVDSAILAGSLRYARLTGTGWALETVDPSPDVVDCSLALDSHNLPHICYLILTGIFDGQQGSSMATLKYAHWTGTAWDIQTVDQQVGAVGGQAKTLSQRAEMLKGKLDTNTIVIFYGVKFCSIAVDSRDIPHITYGSLMPTTTSSLHYAQLNQPIDEGPLPPGQPARLRRSLAPSSPPSTSIQFNPANMSLQYLSVNPQQTTANQPVTISTNVVNTGNEGGNYQVALKINGELIETRMVSVGPLATQPVKFTVSRANPGTYDVAILDKTGSFTVLGGGAAAGSKVGGMIALVVIAILIIGAVVVLLLRFI